MKNNNLRHIREYKGYSQKYLANRLGKSQAAISKIENGDSKLSDKSIEQLCQILKVTKEEIFDEEIGSSHSLNNIVNHLFNQFSENKILLQQVELNQKDLQEQLNTLHSIIIKNPLS